MLGYMRIVLTIHLWYLIVFTEARWIALGVFAIAAITDTADGYLARKNKSVSKYGAFLDLLADKILVVGAMFALVEVGRAWSWVGIVIVAREFAFMSARAVAAFQRKQLLSTRWGKFKMWVQCIAIGLAIMRFDVRIGMLIDEWMMVIAVLYTIVSAGFFFRRHWSKIF